MSLTGGRRLTTSLRPPAGTPDDYIPQVAGGVVTWVPPGMVASPPIERADYDIDIALATAGDWETGSLTLAKSADLYRIRATQSCIVRLYRTAADRDADLSRVYPPDLPTPGSGVFAETGLSGDNGRDQWQSPSARMFNGDTVVTGAIYWAVMNTMLTDVPITVTITALPLET